MLYTQAEGAFARRNTTPSLRRHVLFAQNDAIPALAVQGSACRRNYTEH